MLSKISAIYRNDFSIKMTISKVLGFSEEEKIPYSKSLSNIESDKN